MNNFMTKSRITTVLSDNLKVISHAVTSEDSCEP